MARPNNAMEIFKHLEKTNCRECGEKTCLAFAGAVFQARKTIDMCPRLDGKIVELYSNGNADTDDGSLEEGEQFMEKMRKALAKTDLGDAAKRTGGEYDGARLVLKVLGKDFGVDGEGNFFTDIHVNPWIAGPFLDYVVHAKGVDPVGEWVSFRELRDGRSSYPFFRKRCEEAMKRVADKYTDLFDDLVHIFGGQKTAAQFESDISVVLHPMPKVPMMICYWKQEDGIDSSLHLFFDKSADDNFQNGSAFTIGAGLARMFEKLSERHGAFSESLYRF